MTAIPSTFRAFVAESVGGGESVDRGLRDFAAADLPDGEVEVEIDWSSVNYKDALATIAGGKVARISPLFPGIDLAGEVIDSTSPELPVAPRSSLMATTWASPGTAATPSTRGCRRDTSCRCRRALPRTMRWPSGRPVSPP